MSVVDPLKSLDEVNAVRSLLSNERDHCLFTLGINTAFRGGDFLALNIGEAGKAMASKTITIVEEKTGNRRTCGLNQMCLDALDGQVRRRYLDGGKPSDPLFVGNRNTRMTIGSLGRLWKDWCEAAGLNGNYGSHTGRKSFGYLNRVLHGVPIEVLMKAYGHSHPSITMSYCCIQSEEVSALYGRDF